MILRALELQDFKAFRRALFEPAPQGLTLVAGANNSGKSALLSALDLIAANTPSELRGLAHESPDARTEVAALFDLAEEEARGLLSERSQSGWSFRAFRQVVFKFAIRQGQNHVELVEVLGSRGDGNFFPFIAFEDSENFAGKIRWSNWRKADPMRDRVELINHFGDIEGVEKGLMSTPELRPLHDLLQSWRSGFYHFEALRVGGSRRAKLGGSADLLPDGHNIHQVLLQLALNRRPVFDELGELLSEVVPEVGTLGLLVDGSEVDVGFRQRFADQPFINIKDLGTGVEQLLLVLTASVLRETRATTLILEEPETALHPAAQRSLVAYLRQLSVYDQILISTHSPVFLDANSVQQDLWLVTRKSSNSKVEKVEGVARVALEELGVRLSDVLIADKLILVEGPTDIELLQVWFGKMFLATSLAISHGGGGDNARHTDLLARWMDAADHFQRRELVYLRDRDELSDELVERVQKSGRVKVLAKREIENYLLVPHAILQVMASEYPSCELPDSARIDSLIDEGAEACRNRIIVGRLSRRLHSIVPISHEDRSRLAKAGALKREVIDHVVGKLPRRPEFRTRVGAMWDDEASAVAAMKTAELRDKAPGEDVLDYVFQSVVGHGFSKKSHGPKLAQHIAPPADLVVALGLQPG